MAGAFTHFMICDEAKRRYKDLPFDLFRLLNKHSEFLFLGAASPDLPYLSFKTGNVNWADVMHYENTNGMVKTGFSDLKSRYQADSPAEAIQFAWLMGYVSHLVADATVHPVVQAIVGPYEQNKDEHRLCEMTQDSLLFREIKNNDVYYAEYSSALKFCAHSAYFGQLMEFWQQQALANYGYKEEEPHPSLWFKTYTEAVDSAEGGSETVALFRHLGIAEGYLYKTSEEIRENHKDHYHRYYGKVLLPDGSKGSFRDDVFERAVNNVLEAWKKYYAGLITASSVNNIVRNWNLDTGEDMEQPGKVVTYWG